MENIFGVDVRAVVFDVFGSVGLSDAEASTEALRFLTNLHPDVLQAGTEGDIKRLASERLNLHLAWRGYEPN